MRYIYPIPGDVLYWVSAVHVGAGVLLGMKLLDHLRYVLAPSRWPLMASMATGWISRGYVQRFLPGWYAEHQLVCFVSARLRPRHATLVTAGRHRAAGGAS